MATNENEIGIVLSARDLTADAINSAKKGMEGLGNTTKEHGDKSSAALTGVGYAAKSMAKELGLGGDAARFIGHEFRDMVGTMSGAALKLSMITVAATAAYKVYEYFEDQTRKVREEQIRLGNSMASEVLGMEKNREETDNLRVAKYNLYVQMREIAKENLELAIEAQTQKVIDQVAVINQGGTAWDMITRAAQSYLSMNMTGQWDWAERTAKDLEKPRKELQQTVIALAKMRIQQKELAGDAQSKSAFDGADKSAGIYDNLDSQVKAYEWYIQEQKRLDNEMAGNTWTMADAQVKAFEWAEQEKKRIGEITIAREKAQYELQIQMQDGWMATASNALNTYAAYSDKNAKEIFYVQKALAIAQIYVDTARAAMSAAATSATAGPYAAAAAAASMWYMGYANMAVVAATALFGGSGGSGGGAASGASSSSGSSSSDGSYKYFNYEQSTYGSGWRPGSDKSGNTIHIHGDVYDADKFQKAVSKAWNNSVRNNEYEVKKTAQRYI